MCFLGVATCAYEHGSLLSCAGFARGACKFEFLWILYLLTAITGVASFAAERLVPPRLEILRLRLRELCTCFLSAANCASEDGSLLGCAGFARGVSKLEFLWVLDLLTAMTGVASIATERQVLPRQIILRLGFREC